jgi:hypothetical protein
MDVDPHQRTLQPQDINVVDDVDDESRSREGIHPSPPRSDCAAKKGHESEATGDAADHPENGQEKSRTAANGLPSVTREVDQCFIHYE